MWNALRATFIYIYSACGPLTKSKERIQKFKETGYSRYFYQDELKNDVCNMTMAYGYFKDLTRRRASEKILRDKAFNIAKNLKYDGYQRANKANSSLKKKSKVSREIHLFLASFRKILLSWSRLKW